MYDIGQGNLEGRMLLEFCFLKELCQMRGLRDGRMTFRQGENEAEKFFGVNSIPTAFINSEGNPIGV